MSTQASTTVTREPQVRCPYCSELVAFAAKKCKHCGEFLDPILRKSQQQKWNPGVAAVMSLLIPGTGQMYKGQIGVGIAWLIAVPLGYVAFVLPGVILHITCIFNAYSSNPTKDKVSTGR